jgi:hypothetical protein
MQLEDLYGVREVLALGYSRQGQPHWPLHVCHADTRVLFHLRHGLTLGRSIGSGKADHLQVAEDQEL